MRFHYSRDQVRLKNYSITWRSNKFSLADILTKIHPRKHSIYMRQFYYDPTNQLRKLLGLHLNNKARLITEIKLNNGTKPLKKRKLPSSPETSEATSKENKDKQQRCSGKGCVESKKTQPVAPEHTKRKPVTNG